MGPFEFLAVELDESGVATVTLDRPPVNAVHVPMYEEIRALFADIDQIGGGVRVAVLASAGRHFSAGNDLDEFATMTPDNARVRMFHVREAFFAIQRSAVPVIAAVRGAALGTGLALAASCDFAVATDDARFGLPEISVGVMGGAKHLSRLVPQPMVRWMFFTGEQVPAARLAELGGLISVVPDHQLLPEAHRVARRIASFSPTAVRVAKHGLDSIEFEDTFRGYEAEQRLTAKMSGHPDSKVALAASRRGEPAVYQDFRGLP